MIELTLLDQTWRDKPVLSSDHVDSLILQCDAAESEDSAFVDWGPNSHNPFSIFSSRPLDKQLSSRRRESVIAQGLIYVCSENADERYLFHHYVNRVSFIMMPFEDRRNPWKSHYPAVALQYVSNEQMALYKAILAQSAFNLAHLGGAKEKVFALAIRYYTSAIEDLRENIAEKQGDYGGFRAAGMTLMMVEVRSVQV